MMTANIWWDGLDGVSGNHFQLGSNRMNPVLMSYQYYTVQYRLYISSLGVTTGEGIDCVNYIVWDLQHNA